MQVAAVDRRRYLREVGSAASWDGVLDSELLPLIMCSFPMRTRQKQTGYPSSTPRLAFKRPQIPSNRYHEALNRGTLGGLGYQHFHGLIGAPCKGDPSKPQSVPIGVS